MDHRFTYQGWNLVADFYGPYNGGNFPTGYVRNCFWGLDLSGTMQGAGGVGGLLMTQDAGQTYLPMYDGNGNVHGMIKAADGTIAAAYEYDAFGNTLRESGPYAASNPFRYSTKYTDIETGLVYYGLRYYSPSLGRFLNQDPIAEQGGLNLYGFCGNNGVNRWDYLGQVVLDLAEFSNNDVGSGMSHEAHLAFFDRKNPGTWSPDFSVPDGTLYTEGKSLADQAIDRANLIRDQQTQQQINTALASGRSVSVTDGNGHTQILHPGDTTGISTSGQNLQLGSASFASNNTLRDPDRGPDGVRYVGPMLTDPASLAGRAIDAAGNAAGVAGLFADARGELQQNSYFWRQANGTWRARDAASEANYLLNRSFTLAGERTAIWKAASTKIGIAGLGIAMVDIGYNGLNMRNGADLVFGAIGFAGPIGTAFSTTYTLSMISWDIYHAANPPPPPPQRQTYNPPGGW